MVRVSKWWNLTSEFLFSPRGAAGTGGLDPDLKSVSWSRALHGIQPNIKGVDCEGNLKTQKPQKTFTAMGRTCKLHPETPAGKPDCEVSRAEASI